MGIKLALYKPVDVIYFLLFTPNNNIIKILLSDKLDKI